MVLTTHRMDEAESLCDNIAIMVNGRFVVYGSPGHLKSNYGSGYRVTLQVRDPTVAEQSVVDSLPSLVLKSKDADDEGLTTLEYEYEGDAGSFELSGLFSSLLALKRSCDAIIDFQLTRSSLEAVFVSFAKHQDRPADEA